MRSFGPLVALGCLALLGSAAGHHCGSFTTSTALVEQPPYYVANGVLCPNSSYDCIGTFYLYEETNGHVGLQRFDSLEDDTCHGMIEGDVMVLSLEPTYHLVESWLFYDWSAELDPVTRPVMAVVWEIVY